MKLTTIIVILFFAALVVCFFVNKKIFSAIISAIIKAVVLLIVCYEVDNIPYRFGAKTKMLTFKESIAQKGPHKNPDSENVVFINTGYDLQFVDTHKGREIITNRDTLIQLLQYLQKVDYKYIFLDINFEKGYETPSDSILVALIKSMRDITIAKHWDYKNEKEFELIDDALLEKASYCDFVNSMYNTSISCYQFIQKNGNSAALDIYQNTTNHSIKVHRIGNLKLWYSDRDRLCYNSLFLAISEEYEKQIRTDYSARYLDMGSMKERFGDAIIPYLKGKTICIGDFISDLHDTYYNKQPGTYLHWLAYNNLSNENHIYHRGLILLLFLAYSAIFFCKKINFDLAHLVKKPFFSFLLAYINSSLLLSVTCFIIYCHKGIFIDIFIPTLVFSFYSLYLKIISLLSQSKKTHDK